MPATNNRAITGPAYPSWSRSVARDDSGGLNVAAWRARTAGASAIAPVDVVLRLPDGTRVTLPHERLEVSPTAVAQVVGLPERLPAEVLGALFAAVTNTPVVVPAG